MSDKKDIQRENEEMKKEFPLLFALEKKNPFAVPDDYFEDVEFKISIQVSNDDLNLNSEDFNVPDNYFEELEGKIKNKIELEKLKDDPFTTPENYFDEVENDVRLKLWLDELRQQNFLTPEQYFENSQEDIRRIIWLDSLKQNKFETPFNYFSESEEQLRTSMVLAGLRSENIFDVPANYFETFESRLRERMSDKKEAKIVRVDFSRSFKFIAAAAIIIGVCFFTWLLINGDNISPAKSVQLSAVDKKKIMENPGEFGIDEHTLVEMVSENPELLSSMTDEASEAAVEEIVQDQDIDVSTITGID